jgi:hypothetical protein
MSEENQSPEQPSAEAAHPAEAPAPEPAAAASAAEAPTVQAPVQGEVPPGAVPPGAMPPGPVPPGGGYYYPPGMPVPGQSNGFGRFVRHRATQITAAAVLGLLIGGGTIALVDSASGGPGYGHHRIYPGNSGQGYGFQGGQGGQSGHGGFGRQAPNGN